MESKVRCKFKCINKAESENGFTIHLEPVMSGSEENEQFFKWTTSGVIEVGTVNPAAAVAFKVGHVYYVDFTPAPVDGSAAPE